jgi:Insertion element 4 transposase N-terminal
VVSGVPVVEGVPELSGLGVLTWVYPPDVVNRVVAACGRSEQRRRLFPARLVVYFVLALALFSSAPYLEVLWHLVEGLRGVGRWGAWRIPAKSSLFRTRERLGAEPCGCCLPPRPGRWPRLRHRGRLAGAAVACARRDCWDVADTAANDKAFGRPGTHRGERSEAFPQVRMVALVECGTHAVVDAELDGCRVGEVTLAARLVRSVGPGMLVLADRGVPGGAAVAGVCRNRR